MTYLWSIATVSIIARDNRISDRINGLLSEYGDMVVGRMGMPYREMGLFLITVTLDGSRVSIYCGDIYEHFHLGITGCEGPCRFYDLQIEKE